MTRAAMNTRVSHNFHPFTIFCFSASIPRIDMEQSAQLVLEGQNCKDMERSSSLRIVAKRLCLWREWIITFSIQIRKWNPCCHIFPLLCFVSLSLVSRCRFLTHWNWIESQLKRFWNHTNNKIIIYRFVWFFKNNFQDYYYEKSF